MVVSVSTLFFSALYVFLPDTRDSWIQEGSLLENLTALLAFNSFLVGLYFVLKLKNKRHQRLYIVLPILGLITFLDELSFGEDIVEFDRPTIGGMEIDSLHDFVSLFFKKFILSENRNENGYILSLIIIIIVLAILTLLGIFYRYRKHRSNFRTDIGLKKVGQGYPPLLFLGIAILFGLFAFTVDLRILQFRGAKFLEELFEMHAAFALLMACFSIKALSKKSSLPNECS
ncbi:MAG: hypothetical protein AAGD09_08335 [Cyanobacteria bacterium P01_F01_bin.56]